MARMYIYAALALALLMTGCSAPPKTEEQKGADAPTASNTAPTPTNTAPAMTEPKGTKHPLQFFACANTIVCHSTPPNGHPIPC